MQQILWEKVFNEQFEKILDSHGIDKSDERISALKSKLSFNYRKSCRLMIEVDEDWKEKLTKILEDECGEDPECE